MIEAACCFEWRVLRGPHAGEHATFCIVKEETLIPESDKRTLVLGRHRSKTWFCLSKDLEISTIHAQVQISKMDNAYQWFISDAESTNGTRLNGERIEPNSLHLLKSGDLILLGKTLMQFVARNLCTMSEVLICAHKTESTNGRQSLILKNGQGDERALDMKEQALQIEALTENIVCALCGCDLKDIELDTRFILVNECLNRSKKRKKARSKLSSSQRKQLKLARKKESMVLSAENIKQEGTAAERVKSDASVDCDMRVQLLSSEILQMENDVVSLLRKRANLIMQLEKCEKQLTKSVHSSVRLAGEPLDREDHLDDIGNAVFPSHMSTANTNSRKKNPETEDKRAGSCWTHASQVRLNSQEQNDLESEQQCELSADKENEEGRIIPIVEICNVSTCQNKELDSYVCQTIIHTVELDVEVG